MTLKQHQCISTALNNMRMQCEEQLWISVSIMKRLLFSRESNWNETIWHSNQSRLISTFLVVSVIFLSQLFLKVKPTSRGSQLSSAATTIFSLRQHRKSCLVKLPALSAAIAKQMTQFAIMLRQMIQLVRRRSVVISFSPFFYASSSPSFSSFQLCPPPLHLIPVQTSNSTHVFTQLSYVTEERSQLVCQLQRWRYLHKCLVSWFT